MEGLALRRAVRFRRSLATSAALALAAVVPTLVALPGHSAEPARAGAPQTSQAEKPKIDPAASAALKKATDYLQTLNAFEVRADTTRDVVVGDNYKLQKTEQVDLTVRRPDRMRAEIVGDDRNQEIVDDGKTLTIYSKPENLYATMTALPTVHETLDVAAARYGVEAPLIDILQVAPPR